MFVKKSFICCLLIAILMQLSLRASQYIEIDPLDRMPILEKSPVSSKTSHIEQRNSEYRKFLAASVQIKVKGATGSGTIIYYDSNNNIAYVASCGHLWSPGIMNAQEGYKKSCQVMTYYHNNKKLDSPINYDANLIFYSYISGQDTSLITFKPDWKPQYFPIAPINYQYKTNSLAHSLGCDNGEEVAHYHVKILGVFGDLVTNENSPRPGRSGGGLMDDSGYYIGTCWGTQYRDGSGNGYFTPLHVIHRFWGQQKGYEFLLCQKPENPLARKLPIIDKNNPQRKYDPEYILLPN